MSLDQDHSQRAISSTQNQPSFQTLDNLNSTLTRIAGLLQTVEIAIIIVAVALAILMIGSVATCYYDKYKKYHQLPVDNTNPSYERSSFHYKNVNETA